jgi:hypothetical protein
VSTADTELHPEDVHRSGDAIAQSVQQLRQKVDAFQVTLAGYGEPWGNDDLGALIGGCYQVIADLAFECLEDNVAHLEGYGEGLHAMAASYEDNEQQIVGNFRQLHDRLG